MDSEAAGESGKPEENLVERILKEHQVLDLDIGEGVKIEAGDQFFGIAQPMAEEGKLIAPLDSIMDQQDLSTYIDKKDKTYGIFELIKKGKIGFVDLKNLPSNISLFDFCRFRFEITAILDQKIKNIGHPFYARILREELSGVKHTHYKKGVKFLTEVPEKFRKM